VKFRIKSMTNFRVAEIFVHSVKVSNPTSSLVFQFARICRNYGSIRQFFNPLESVGTPAEFESISIHKSLSELRQYSEVLQSTRVCRNYGSLLKIYQNRKILLAFSKRVPTKIRNLRWD
jgi:hypothetical protein